jgi:hypothetical protein
MSDTTSTPTMTIEELEVMAGRNQGCCVLSVLRRILGLQAKECPRRAVVMIVMECEGCGITRRGVCRLHLRLIRSSRAYLTCHPCGLRGTWRSV